MTLGHLLTNLLPLLASSPWSSGYVSPFDWGGEGAGVDRLAANLPAYCGLPADFAWRLAIRFSTEVLAKIPRDGGKLSSVVVMACLDANPDAAHSTRTAPARCAHGHRPIITDPDTRGLRLR